MRQPSNRLPSIQSQYIALSGGIDLTTPPIAKANSEAITALNVQPHYGGGFTRIEGYECLDGKTVPSEMDFYNLYVGESLSPNLIGQRFSFGNQTCQVINVDGNKLVVASSSKITGDAGNKFVINGESYTLTASVNQNVVIVTDIERYKSAAFQVGIEWVNTVPGESDIRGVVELEGNIIAFRDIGEKCGVFLSDVQQGWKEVGVTYVIQLQDIKKPKDLISGVEVQYSGNKSRILSAVLAPDNLSGFIVLSGNVPVNTQLHINGAVVATVKSCDKVTLEKGKTWQFIYHNFYGTSKTQYAYGCNGEQIIEVRPDGLVIPIAVETPKPIYVCEHRNHLFAAFEGGQLGHSMVGAPNKWSVLLGAEQFGVGDEITALSSSVGGVLLIGCRSKTVGLYGSTSADWVMKEVSKVGIFPNTLQSVYAPIAVTTNGITRIDQTEQFGDFLLSEMDANRKIGFNPAREKILFSSVKPNVNQIRLYGKDRNFCIMLSLDGTTKTTTFTYPETVSGLWQTPKTVFMAFGDGKIYRQSDFCYSFAGKPINWLIKLAFNHCGSPTVVKNWRSAELQATTEGVAIISYRYDLDYNSIIHAANLNQPVEIAGGGGRWNDSLWNDFLWSAEDYSTPNFLLSGYSRNIALSISGNSIFTPQFEISGLILNYLPRRMYRV